MGIRKLRKLFCVIVVVCMMILDVAYATNTISSSFYAPNVDASLMNTYLAEDESGNNEIQFVVNNFVNNYIKITMTDFEKEMQIIKYLVSTVAFDTLELGNADLHINDSYKAYGALVNKKAVCSGYAKAFDLLAKASGLYTNIVTGTAINSSALSGPHAWNQICLDNEWYNVDVTWEDPITNIELGFDRLFNNYINRTDAEFSLNHIRDNGNMCTATKYGKETVSYYLETGMVNTSANIDDLRRGYIAELSMLNQQGATSSFSAVVDKFTMLGVKFDDNSNFINANDMEVNAYVLNHIANGETVITFVTLPGTYGTLSIDKDDWLKNFMQFQGSYSMHKYFSSDGKLDTRILIFKMT